MLEVALSFYPLREPGVSLKAWRIHALIDGHEDIACYSLKQCTDHHPMHSISRKYFRLLQKPVFLDMAHVDMDLKKYYMKDFQVKNIAVVLCVFDTAET